MLISTILILIAWFVKMPLWLSILTTVFSGLYFIADCLDNYAKYK